MPNTAPVPSIAICSVVFAAVALFTAAPLAYACGKGQQQVFTCKTKNNKVVEVCNAGKDATYSFGRAGAKPELFLRQPKSKLIYRRYSGSGGGSEHVTFPNGRISYEVTNWVAFGRTYADGRKGSAGESGQISVMQGDRQIADIECRDNTLKANLGDLGMEPAVD